MSGCTACAMRPDMPGRAGSGHRRVDAGVAETDDVDFPVTGDVGDEARSRRAPALVGAEGGDRALGWAEGAVAARGGRPHAVEAEAHDVRAPVAVEIAEHARSVRAVPA